jgi:NADH-quinone oxidoreductase subunit L
LIAGVGGATALFAASIALVQNDIKKVLAYSTVSQLGFMVMACGVGAFRTGFFHVFTHACFKALLFMGAGSVIVAMHHEQDMRSMGGLRKYLPITHAVFLVGVLAIIGFPGFSGFFSKDEILWHAYLGGGWPLWSLGVISASLTAFYMVRLLCLTFYGSNRSDHHTQEHLHETSAVMWAPLVVLAILSVVAGYLGVPEFIFGKGSNILHHYFADHIIAVPDAAEIHWAFLKEHHSHALEWGLLIGSTSIVLSAAAFSFFVYRNGPSVAMAKLAERFQRCYQTLLNKYWVDELYGKVFVEPLRDMGAFLYRVFDVIIVDGVVNGLAHATNLVAGVTSFKMSGSLHRHGMVIMLGVVCLLTALFFA